MTRGAMTRGILFVVSGPSGSGKHTVLRRVMEGDAHLAYSISATSRAPRPGEVDGRDYYFLDAAEFGKRVEAGEFAEWAEVHGNLYGTLRVELTRRLADGSDVALAIDVQGMRNLRALETGVVTVFVMPPSLAVLEQRLRGRGANDEADIALRLANARREMAVCGSFDYIVVNDGVDEAVADLRAITRAERRRAHRWLEAHPLADKDKGLQPLVS